MPALPLRRLLILVVILFLSWPPTTALRLNDWRSLLSLSHSLLDRVANARTARGDAAAAARARRLGDHLRLSGAGFWSLGFDFARNYVFSGGGAADLPLPEISRAAVKLLYAVDEFRRLDSAAARARWVARKSPELVEVVESVVKGLLRTFSRSGALRDAVLLLQKEVVDGELLRDCLEVGAADFEGLLRIAKSFVSSSNSHHSEL